MNPFPDKHSVLIMDNCQIHHTDALQDVLNDARKWTVIQPTFTISFSVTTTFIDIMLIYLPPYSPDLNPIEESFSVCAFKQVHLINILTNMSIFREGTSATKRGGSPK